MIDRRRLMFTAAAGAGLAASGRALALPLALPATRQDAGQDAGAALHALMDRVMREQVMSSPEMLTMLGLDKGPAAPMKARLDDRSMARTQRDRAFFRQAGAELDAIDRSALSARDAVYYDTVKFFGDTAQVGYEFPYGGGLYPSPYTVSQLSGSYQSLPDFLDSQHAIDTREDAEAYLSRVSAFAVALDQETGRMEAEFAAGAVPPDFVIDRTLGQMAAITGAPAAESTLVRSLVRRAADRGLEGDWGERALALVEREVLPALNRQADTLRARRADAVHDAGCWRLPDGDAYYAYGLRFYTTSSLNGDEIHEMGLEQVAALSARADALLRAQGLTQGAVGQRIAALGQDARFLYPDTDEAKAQLLSDLNDQMAAMARRLPDYFGRLPRSPVEVRRVPVEIEAGAPGGYYMSPSLDGTRPGAYYINLRDTAEWPRWSLPTLTYHEASPGHHFQIALQQENAGTPMLLKVLNFSAYAEGWGLYAEQLADEMGVYADDPWGQIGYLQSLMFRAARLVVDSGLHHKRWSREQGVRYMVETLGDKETTIATEVERYSVWPGQAASYKVGHTVIDRLRNEARTRLGAAFDIRAFHDMVLDVGGVPLTVLERVVNDWTAAQG